MHGSAIVAVQFCKRKSRGSTEKGSVQTPNESGKQFNSYHISLKILMDLTTLQELDLDNRK